jgi:hypothetical protein
MVMDTVRIEYMLVNEQGSVISNWTTMEGSIQNNAQVYVERANQVLRRVGQGSWKPRVRVVSEQTNRIVDIIQ